MKSFKKVVSLWIICFLMLTVMPVTARAEQTVTLNATTVAKVNLRDAATMDSQIIRLLPQGADVEVLGNQGNWQKVRVDNEIGWVYGTFLTQNKGQVKSYVTLEEVVLRKEPKSTATAVATINKGQSLNFLELSGSYLKVEVNGKIGYVLMSSVTESALAGENNVVAPKVNDKIEVFQTIAVYMNAADAAKGVNSVGTYPAGEYFVYRNYSGMVNVTRFADVPGAWINPGDNKDVKPSPEKPADPVKETPDQAGTYELKFTAKTYLNAYDAQQGTNSVGSYQPGKYFIYKTFGEMINITTKESQAGAWINPGTTLEKPQEPKPVEPKPEEPKPEEPKPEPVEDPIVTTAAVNMREKASNQSQILKILPVKTTASMKGLSGSWLKIEYNDQIGYSYKSYWSVPKETMEKYAPEVKEPVKTEPNKNLKVYLDPGHNGTGQGAVSTVTGEVVDENTINYRVAKLTKELLESRGYEVFISKDHENHAVSLEKRAYEANRLDVDIFVSIHCNSYTSSSPKGSIAFSAGSKLNPTLKDWKERSWKLSENIAAGLAKVTGSGMVVKDTDWVGSLSVNRNSNMPSTLLELGFITNYQDAVILDSSAGQKDIAKEISNGIDKYFGFR